MKYLGSMALIGGLGLGAGAWRLLGPGTLHRRKNVLKDKAIHAAHEIGGAANVTAKDMKNRARGLFWETLPLRARLSTDETIVARVRSKLGRVCSNPGAVEVDCTDGRVVLTGQILEEEVGQVMRAIENVRGVREVDNRLDVYSQPGDHPSLQSPAIREGERFELAQEKWSPTARVLAGATGGAALAYGIKSLIDVRSLRARRRRMRLLEQTLLIRGAATAIPTGLLGLGLLARSISNKRVRQVAGFEGGAIRLQKTVHVNAPIEECFAFWSSMETFPRFMQHVKQVQRVDGNRWHWRVEGPLGTTFHWDAEITEIDQNRLIRWRSIEGSTVHNDGSVRFDPGEHGETRIQVDMRYTPPAGALGHAFARVFGVDPRKQMDDDLNRLKSLLEAGKTTAHHREVRASDLTEDLRPRH